MILPMLLAGCGDKDASSPAGTADTGDTSAIDTRDCGSAGGSLPEGLTELSWDDGLGGVILEDQGWTVYDEPLDEQVLSEAVRFELAHPARVYGFAVQYGQLPDAESVVAGLYDDFGHNGFDFWAPDPLWTGDHCVEDLTEEQWVVFALDEPITVSHPGLIYVAHQRQGKGDAAWLLDLSYNGDGTCAGFDECHSALNLPEWTGSSYGGYYNGVSFGFPYDYMVRLYVEYTDDVQPEETLLQPLAGVEPSSRQAWGDYNNDGYDDLLTNGPVLYHNNGDGTFTDVTDTAAITAMGISASGGVWGDYDNDDDLDLFVFAESGTTGDSLLRNEGDGTFTDVTAAAGITDVQDTNDCAGSGYTASPTPAAAWLDLNADGFLDLYLSNFICWTDYTYFTDTVFLSNGDGTFAEQTGAMGFSSSALAGRGASPIDHDRDGDIDLLVNNYVLHRNLFFDNLGDGTVEESAQTLGLAGVGVSQGMQVYYGHTIGAAWGDLDNDGDFDVVQANLAHPRFYDFSDKTQILLDDGTGQYSDIQGDWSYPAGAAGLRFQETHSVPVLGDFDNDGVLDLALSAVYDGRPSDFYWGNGDGTFTLDNYTVGLTRDNGWGMAASDLDNDGDLDLAAYGEVYRNTLSDGGAWLQVRVVGTESNRAGLGAVVAVTADGQTRLRHIGGGTGQGNQDSITAHFGLGSASTIDEIAVSFPGGSQVTYDGPFSTDQRLWLVEDGSWSAGWTYAD